HLYRVSGRRLAERLERRRRVRPQHLECARPEAWLTIRSPSRVRRFCERCHRAVPATRCARAPTPTGPLQQRAERSSLRAPFLTIRSDVPATPQGAPSHPSLQVECLSTWAIVVAPRKAGVRDAAANSPRFPADAARSGRLQCAAT